MTNIQIFYSIMEMSFQNFEYTLVFLIIHFKRFCLNTYQITFCDNLLFGSGSKLFETLLVMKKKKINFFF